MAFLLCPPPSGPLRAASPSPSPVRGAAPLAAQPRSLMGWVCAVGCVSLLQEAGAGRLDAGTSQHMLLPGLVCAPAQSGLGTTVVGSCRTQQWRDRSLPPSGTQFPHHEPGRLSLRFLRPTLQGTGHWCRTDAGSHPSRMLGGLFLMASGSTFRCLLLPTPHFWNLPQPPLPRTTPGPVLPHLHHCLCV